MRGRRLHVSLVALAAAANAVIVLVLYAGNGGASHFALHALLGSSTGFSVLLIWRGLGKRPRRGELWLPYALTAYAMVPDFIYKLGPFHRDWMDVFLGHVSADELRVVLNPVILIVMVLLVAVYVRLEGERRQATQLLQPCWVSRPWGRLCVRTSGRGPVVVALHGLGGSGRYWEGLANALGGEWMIIAPDLGGFGDSDKPRLEYDIDFHLANIDAALGHCYPEGPLTVVGHSFGGALAALWATRHPERAEALAIISAPAPEHHSDAPPTFPRNRAGQVLVRGHALPYLVHIAGGAVSKLLLPFVRSTYISREIMVDYMKHTIRSYVGSMRAVLLDQDIIPLLRPLKRTSRLLLLYGKRDPEVNLDSARRLQRALGADTIETTDHGHQLLLETGFEPLIAWLRPPNSQADRAIPRGGHAPDES